MDMLSVHKNQIVDSNGQAIRLRGTCIGGWMNMEHFINGYPGVEQGIRAAMADVLGGNKAQFFFDRWLDHFLAEDDIAFIRSLGANVVRLPLNYRHFENDAAPFHILEKGFERLERAVQWCERHGLYVILDLHAVQGWQNPDWHCDNPTQNALIWKHPHFQERFVALWEEFARRYRGNATIAGYDVMNEPVTNARYGYFNYISDWDAMNNLYRRVVKAIRAIDPEHIIFLEGDGFASKFAGLDAPFAENLVYSSHNYSASGFGPGEYPGYFFGNWRDRDKQLQVFLGNEGTQFAQKHNVPLWVGEFGAVYNGAAEEKPYRLRAVDDQIDGFEEFGAHWTTWTFKDVGVMGWVNVNPQSDYMQRIAPMFAAKEKLFTDSWMDWLPMTPARQMAWDLADHVTATLVDPSIDANANRNHLARVVLAGYTGAVMQPLFAKRFESMSEYDLDCVAQSFAFNHCQPNTGLVETVKKHMGR